VLFRERLTVPLMWWVLAVLLALSLTVAVGFYLGLWWGGGVFVGSLAIIARVFASAAIEVRVSDAELVVGRARIDHRYLAGAQALDVEQTRRRSSVDADARAHLALRPYVPTAVEITLDDPDDPVPYWLVSSRRPRALADALGAAISSKVTG
jgi:Protein of unknown function (DUF3093)